MSYVDDPFDPCSITNPRLRMPGVLDFDVENNQLNMVNFTAIDNRTANVAVRKSRHSVQMQMPSTRKCWTVKGKHW